MNPDADAPLIERVKRGDVKAFEMLVVKYQRRIERLIGRMVRDVDLVPDIAQETFIRAYAALARFDRARPLRPWLLHIAGNLASNRRRSLRRYLATLQRAFMGAPQSAPPPDADGGWEAQTLWQAMRGLGHADQEVIYLRYFLELSEAEAARALGVAQGTVKSRLSRALARLRAVINSEFPALRAERDGEA
jgi:RNA polymerase sigma-70 factor (ECF subfamily)